MIPRIGDEHRRALGLGLSGAHRTGKTTVGRVLAEEAGCPLLLSSTSAIAAEIGFRMDGSEPMSRRQQLQDEVLKRHEHLWETEGQNGLFVADRTPLDFATYALVDWHMSRSTPEGDAWLLDYVDRCMEATGRYFFGVVLVQPGIKFVADEGKPPQNDVYQEAMNTTIMGLGSDMRVRSNFLVVPRRLLDVMERATFIGDWYDARMAAYAERLQERLPRAS